MAASQPNLYQVLMLDPGVDADLMATVYRRLVQRYQSAPQAGGSSTQRLLAVERAYEILREPHRRARYDAQLAEQDDREDMPQPVVMPAATPTVMPVMVPVATQRRAATRTVPVSVLDFGRYAGWSLRQLAAHDPNYLEWLLRSPGGRQYHAEITALLQPR